MKGDTGLILRAIDMTTRQKWNHVSNRQFEGGESLFGGDVYVEGMFFFLGVKGADEIFDRDGW